MYVNWDDQNSIRAELDNLQCPSGHIGAIAIIPGAAPHFAAILCADGDCGYHHGWLPYPPRSKNEEKLRRRSKRIRTDDDYCDWCLRTRDQLPDGVTLEIRHRVDRAALIDLGKPPDEDANQGWICSAPCKGIELALRAYFDHEYRGVA